MAAMLALRGINSYFPSVDHGCDLLADGLVRVQVKCTRFSQYNIKAYPQGAYYFHLRRAAYARGNKTIVKCSPRMFSEDCDFVVFWGIDEDRFWVIPASDVDKVSCVVLGPRTVGHGQYRLDIAPDEVKELYNSGWTVADLCRHYGCREGTINKRLSGEITTPKYTITAKVRACEDRWDFIDGYLSTMTQAENCLVSSLTPSDKEINPMRMNSDPVYTNHSDYPKAELIGGDR